MEPDGQASEFEQILEDLSYELTAARSAGLSEPDRVREILRRMKDLVINADTLAGSLAAERRRAEGFSGRTYDEL
jgi:hypothetical protein